MEKTNMEKQIQPNELTIFQQLAIESEVASIIDNCANDIEKAYYTFMKFALVEEKYLIAYKHEFMKYVDSYLETFSTYLFKSDSLIYVPEGNLIIFLSLST